MTQNNINSKNPLIQIVNSNTTSLVTCSTAMPYDNTIPQNTEGTEVLTLAITPVYSTSKLEIVFSSQGTGNGTPTSVNVALFQDSTAGALAAAAYKLESPAEGRVTFLRHIMTAGTTSSTTFKIRVGPNAGTYYINGLTGGTRIFGGVASTRLTIKEYYA